VRRERGFESYAGVRALVFGGTGFIGAWLVRAVLGHGAQLTVAGRNASAASALREWCGGAFEFLECDVCDDQRVLRTVDAVRPHVTFNLAGYGVNRTERDEGQAYRVNGRFVGVLCGAVSRSRDPAWPGAALVHAGTQLEYGPVGRALREDRVPQPTTTYGRSKLEGTRALQACALSSGLPAFTARLFNVYGPGERPGRLLPSLMRAASEGVALPLTEGEQQADFVYVEDVAEGLLRLGLAHAGEPGEIVNLATGQPTSVREFVERAAHLLGLPADRLLFGALPPRAETLQYDAVSTERLRQRTGWMPAADIDEGIRRTIERRGWVYARS
jgi:nucleoside-diphosphate-sugar epimerase